MAGSIKTKLDDDVANLLRKAIIEGQYPPDYHLNEAELSRELGISRGPIREAINQLEADGLVYRPSNGRTKVLKFDSDDYEDYLKLRYYLESEACKMIMVRAREDPTFPGWLEAEKQDLRQLEHSIENNVNIITNQYDYAFHDSLLKRADRPILSRAWKSISGIRRSIMETNIKYAEEQRKDYFRTHMGILEGIESGDFSLLEQRLQEHFASGRSHFGRMLNLTRRAKGE